jgi:hypothetical protein
MLRMEDKMRRSEEFQRLQALAEQSGVRDWMSVVERELQPRVAQRFGVDPTAAALAMRTADAVLPAHTANALSHYRRFNRAQRCRLPLNAPVPTILVLDQHGPQPLIQPHAPSTIIAATAASPAATAPATTGATSPAASTAPATTGATMDATPRIDTPSAKAVATCTVCAPIDVAERMPTDAAAADAVMAAAAAVAASPLRPIAPRSRLDLVVGGSVT